MTTEESFNRMLDTDPTDWMTRLVYADWLEEQGDPRATGYRALGRLNLYPDMRWVYLFLRYGAIDWTVDRWPDRSVLPDDWISAADVQATAKGVSRGEAEDVAALAFLRLPLERQQELLKQPALC